MKKTNNVLVKAVGAALFSCVFLLNICAFQKTDFSIGTVKLENLLSNASADSESGGSTLKWSSPISCPGWFNGSYCVCNENGNGQAQAYLDGEDLIYTITTDKQKHVIINASPNDPAVVKLHDFFEKMNFLISPINNK